MIIDESIFKAYDIRGLYPSQLNENTAYAIARAFGTLLQSEKPGASLTVAVGADMRTSSPSLKTKIIAGLTGSGVNVIDIGLVSTPVYYFAVSNSGYDGGVQISASHNPADWNGLKIVRAGAVPVGAKSGMDRILEIIRDDAFFEPAAPGAVTEKLNVVSEAIFSQIQTLDLSKVKPFKVVADTANAMGAPDIEALFTHLPCQLIPMNFELDGTFPAHEADPLKEENLADLAREVVAEGADLGISTDGDADRIFFVDDKGQIVHPAILRGLMAQIELQENPGATIAYDIRPGRITRDMIESHGGRPLIAPVGSVLIKELMAKEGAVFGGESSGHFMFKLPYGTFEAPMLLAAKLLIYLSEQGKPFSEVIAPYNKYAHSGEINTKVASRDEVNQKIAAITQKYSDGQQTALDGITVEYPDYWFNVRASNTEPIIRLTVEARSREIMEVKRYELLNLIRA